MTVSRRTPPATPPSLRPALRLVDDCRLGVRAAGRGVIEFYNSENLTFASSIAYYSLLSLFPFLLLLLTLFGRFAVGMNNETLVQLVIRTLPSHFDFVIDQLAELSKAPPGLGVIGTIVMIWASMGVFGATTSAVNHAWGVEKPHSFVKHKVIALGMLAVAGLLMVAALSLVSLAEIAEARWFSTLIGRFPGLAAFRGFAIQNAPTPLFVLIVGLIYYYVPNAKVRLRDIWFGALLAGLLWRLAFSAFSWYVRDLSRFSVHGSIAAVVVFLAWVYLSAVILLYGAEVSAAHARLHKNLPSSAPAAAVREV